MALCASVSKAKYGMYASSWCESSVHFAILHAEHEQIIPDFEIIVYQEPMCQMTYVPIST